jgi:signal transduction histidine kinase
MQVLAKERARAELSEAQQRMIKMSRLSGMAEVATGVLHNVGNVLNSVNVSSTLIEGRIREMRVDNLAESIDLLNRNCATLTSYVAEDPKGRRVMPYLQKLIKHFKEERVVLLSELELLRNHIGHIKEIVATQQTYARVSGLIEDVCLATLVEDAFRIIQAGMLRHEIRLERNFDEVPPIPVDKHKVLQIMLNLLRNAQQAIKQSDNPERTIRVGIHQAGKNRVQVVVQDTGIGLERENLTRIFAHGFTTKPDGHGFGLHSGALAAKEMGGSLQAHSDGPGKGATFVLELRGVEARKTERSVA